MSKFWQNRLSMVTGLLENSSIYIVKGHEGAGKTLFVKKLKNLFETQNDGKFVSF